MLKFGFTVCLTILMPVAANAEIYATIMKVTPNYSYTKSYTKKKSCHTIDEPIYGQTSVHGASSGDVLTGIVLGGLLGKGATGKDKGAAAGAVLGGIIAANRNNTKSTIIGYRQVPNCEIIQVPQKTKTIKNYKIDYEWGGIFGSSYTYNNYHVGQHIPVSVNITAK
jgi:uncharacterized protein YcfJ